MLSALLKILASNYTRILASSISLYQTLFNHGTSPTSMKISLHQITLGFLGNHTSHAIHSSNPRMSSVLLKNSLAHNYNIAPKVSIVVSFPVSSTPAQVELSLPQLANAYYHYDFHLATPPQRLIMSILTSGSPEWPWVFFTSPLQADVECLTSLETITALPGTTSKVINITFFIPQQDTTKAPTYS